MKSRIKIIIGENVYEAESMHEVYLSTVGRSIECIIKQEILLMEAKHKIETTPTNSTKN